MRFELIAKQGLETVATIKGEKHVREEHLPLTTIGDLIKMEEVLERLLGFRIHINVQQEPE